MTSLLGMSLGCDNILVFGPIDKVGNSLKYFAEYFEVSLCYPLKAVLCLSRLFVLRGSFYLWQIVKKKRIMVLNSFLLEFLGLS